MKLTSLVDKCHSELFRLAQLGDILQFQQFVSENFPSDKNLGSVHRSKSGDTVAIVAASCGHGDILNACCNADLEASNKDGKRPLHAATQAGHTECVRLLLQRKVTIDCLKRADWTPLMLACAKDNLKIIRELISCKANPLLTNKDGWNCLHLAAREGFAPIVEFLFDVEPDIWNTTSNNKRTPLHTAALHGNLDVVRILITRGHYGANERDSCGTTPLMDALRADHVDVARVLVSDHKADIHAEDRMGRRPLHLAAQANAVNSLSFLIDIGCVDVNVVTHSMHETALHLAAREGHRNAVQFLLTSGADSSLRTTHGRTALDVARSAKHKECIVLIESLCKDTLSKVDDVWSHG